EVSKIYSVCGMLPQGQSLLDCRPFRSPHHTSSPQSLTGGGKIPRPGEISLASRGVLFLDEFPEFQKRTIEVLRQPLEEHRIKLSRVYGTCEFPAHFMLAAAMNPCPCGFYPDRSRCSCDESQVRHYLGKISRPLMDRIDICVEASPMTYREMQTEEKNESSAVIRKRVMKAWEIQKRRYRESECHFNSDMDQQDLVRYCKLTPEDNEFLGSICESMYLSVRGCHKILKVARTIADLDNSISIRRLHLAEAVSYRRLEEKYWGKGV
ncbi:MAG: YifB family Mg chelatase-like AAA ATPase, partial [Lachnospiraceae bacterium]